MRQIREGEIRFVGDDIQFHGAAQRKLKRLARKFSRQEGHKVSAKQVAEGLIARFRRDIGIRAEIRAELERALNRIRRILGEGETQ